MKRTLQLILQLSAVSLLLGCGCSTVQKCPLQPGEKIIFQDEARANAFRVASRNDASATGRVVRIEQPVVVVFD